MKGSFVRGIYSGMLVSFGGIIFLSVENRYLGSFLFSFALLTILICGFDLFTGKVGYARSLEDAKRLGVMLLGNFVGCGIIAELARAGMGISSAAVDAVVQPHPLAAAIPAAAVPAAIPPASAAAIPVPVARQRPAQAATPAVAAPAAWAAAEAADKPPTPRFST